MTQRLALCLLIVGCARPGAVDPAAEGLSLSPVEAEEASWDLVIVNHADAVVRVADTLETDALQPDGRWEPVDHYWVYGDDERPAGERDVHPGESTRLSARHYRPLVGGLGPGTFRARQPVEIAGEPSELLLEYTVVGWPAEAAREADALRARAVDEDCGALAADIAELTDQRLEPDPLVDRHRAELDPERRGEVLREMLRRGQLVDHVARELELASMTEVRDAAYQLRSAPRDVQVDARRVVAARLLALFEAPEPVDVGDLHVLERLGDAWPDDGVTLALTRLADGPETDEAAVELMSMFIYLPDALFEGRRAEVLEAAAPRCGAAEDRAMREACASVERRFTAEAGMWLAGRGWGSGCGWRMSSGRAICEDLTERWDALRARWGEPELVFH